MHIVILSSSVRQGRNSHRVALYFQNFITQNKIATVELVDLVSCNFPIFHERLKNIPDAGKDVLDFQQKIKEADGILIVTPEYNGGYPASLKNVIDLLYEAWRRKPIAVATVSSGPFAGSQVLTSLVFSLWKIGAWVVPSIFSVPKVQESYDEKGNAIDKENSDKNAQRFLAEILWCMKANKKMAEASES